MRKGNRVAVIIPALNEEKAIGKVMAAVPEWVDDVILVDNGSTDNTPTIAAEHGARIIFEPRRGYGSACLTGISCLENPDIVVFLNGDYSDRPEEADLLVDPIIVGRADLVTGSRVLGNREAGALTPQAVFGNWLSRKLIAPLWKIRFTDMGPFRAIRFTALQRPGMCDPDYDWTVEMQIKASKEGLRCLEVPVSYRQRIGKSKISWTIKGVVGAGTKILYTIFADALEGFLARKHPEEIIIVFCRYPVPGKTKTRLIPALGPRGAADYHRFLTELTVDKASDACRDNSRRTVEVHYTGVDARFMSEWLGPHLVYSDQATGDLGQRMNSAFEEVFRNGAKRAILIGTDIMGLSTALLDEALFKLRSHELVLGPSQDGGYYLVGLNRPFGSLFQGVEWGTNTVMQDTLRIAREHGLAYATVAPLKDFDRPEDLILHEGRSLRKAESPAVETGRPLMGSISVIIPTLNEESNLAKTLATVTGFDNVETIVVDGGSTDRTVDIARGHDVRVLSGPQRKAVQMNLGALAASGEFLVFLHADTVMPEGWIDHVRREMQRPGAIAGAFELRIDCDRSALRLIEALANFRSRSLGMPYGDQAIFIKTDTFRALGGFPNQPIMEDFELMRRLRKRGRINIAPAAVLTHARRWKKRGIWATTAINQVLIVAYSMGISPKLLARLYVR
ncbi:MAG: TIGR04283 family arsenosugar biosynthesis glycosyltransferase [Desulfomonile tiedjei]|uniref:TIGR04283 family arsenosugar biosynthesis glycosyltransferase n=1 Tax=Desulfomonile tiedjei TaxID=2358 RepID=A0A9D6V430_9BACT|nr:TIGR04283 family arsenosugar biosynthesis glycosyltransferase [Desulfomonile tiedjei]